MGLLKNQSILNDSTSAAQNYGSVMGGTGLTSGMGNIGYDDFLDSAKKHQYDIEIFRNVIQKIWGSLFGL